MNASAVLFLPLLVTHIILVTHVGQARTETPPRQAVASVSQNDRLRPYCCKRIFNDPFNNHCKVIFPQSWDILPFYETFFLYLCPRRGATHEPFFPRTVVGGRQRSATTLILNLAHCLEFAECYWCFLSCQILTSILPSSWRLYLLSCAMPTASITS